MKLITELVNDVQFITEENDGKKSLYIAGPFLCGEQVNKNGRYYPMKLLEREVERYTKECIKENRAYGELNHPTTPTVNLDRVALLVKDLHREGSNYVGKAKITTETPMGAIAKALIDEGANLGVSSRGVGSLKQSPKGYNEVQEDFRLCVAADIVSDPSGIGCFVQGVMENASWIYDPVKGTWVEEHIENIKNEAKQMTKEEREFKAYSIFEQVVMDILQAKK
jgi:hypothetical protein